MYIIWRSVRVVGIEHAMLNQQETLAKIRKGLTAPELRCFEALAFHQTGRLEQPYAALKNSPALREGQIFKEQVRAAILASDAKPDLEKLGYAIASALEGPGCIPGLISVRALNELDFFECNIYNERGEPFTIENLVRLDSAGLVAHAEWCFDTLPERGIDVLGNYFHFTELGVEFCETYYGDKMLALKKKRGLDHARL